MHAPQDKRRGRARTPALGVLSARFAGWWFAFYAGLVAIALTEGIALRQLGMEYISRHALSHVRVRDVDASADGRWTVALVCFRYRRAGAGFINDVVVHDSQERTTRRLHLGELEPRCVAISPTGHSIAVGCVDRSVRVWQGPASGDEHRGRANEPARVLHRLRDQWIARLVFSPDGRHLAVLGPRHVHLLRYPEGRLTARLTPHGETIDAFFSSDSRHLIALDSERRTSRYDTGSGRHIGSAEWTDSPHIQVALSGSGT
jgi:WD40 repeat protein